MLGAVPGASRKAATVSATSVTIRIPPNAARIRVTTVSKPVSSLKCDGTRRHAWSVIRAVSTTQAAANTPRTRTRARSPSRTNEATHAIVTRVSPNDRPKVTGLRHDTGPVHGPPSTAKTTRWTRPDAMSAAPIA